MIAEPPGEQEKKTFPPHDFRGFGVGNGGNDRETDGKITKCLSPYVNSRLWSPRTAVQSADRMRTIRSGPLRTT